MCIHPNLLIYPYTFFLLVTISLFSMSVALFVNKFICFVLFFNSAYKWYHMICLSLSDLPFAATSMDLEVIRLSKVSQIKKDKYHMISLIYGIKQRKYTSTCLWNVGVLNYNESSGSRTGQLNIRTHCSLSPLGVHNQHPVGRNWGCCQTPYNAQGCPHSKDFSKCHQMSVVTNLGHLELEECDMCVLRVIFD